MHAQNGSNFIDLQPIRVSLEKLFDFGSVHVQFRGNRRHRLFASITAEDMRERQDSRIARGKGETEACGSSACRSGIGVQCDRGNQSPVVQETAATRCREVGLSLAATRE